MQGGDSMRKRRVFWILLTVLGLLAMLAAACGGGGNGGKATSPAGTAAPAGTAGAEATEAAETPAPIAATETEGVTDTEIVIGTHQPLTGPAAAYAQISTGMKAYFDYFNDTEGGVYGRKIKLLVEDDQYSPPITVEVVRRLVEQDHIFAMLGGLGTATHMQVVDYLRDRAIPDFFVSTGALEWVKDPFARDNVYGILPNYVGEGVVMGKYIADNYAGGKLGFVGQNDDFGLDGFDGIKRGVGDALEILPEETFESTDPDVNSQVDRLQAAGATVMVVFATPAQAPAAIKHARADLGWDVPIFMSTVAANELTILLAGAENAAGVFTDEALKHAYETDDPAIQKHLQIMKQYAGLDAGSNLTLYGQSLAEGFINVLKEAGPDLTRSGLIEAAEDGPAFTCSVCYFPAKFSEDDHDATQTVVMSKIELDPAQTFGAKFVPFGDAYTWDGFLPQDLTVGDLQTVPFSDPYLSTAP
jgi:branched-chain amino acid transport system substrate-binding protein